MNNKKLWLLLIFLFVSVSYITAQDVDDWEKEYHEFVEDVEKEYKAFRDSAYAEYLEFARKAWAEYEGKPAQEIPEPAVIYPIITDETEVGTNSWLSNQIGKLAKLFKRKKKMPKAGTLKSVQGGGENLGKGEIIRPDTVLPQPQPIFEVYETKEKENNYQPFTVYGTEFWVRIGDNCHPSIRSLKSDAIVDAMTVFTQPQYDNMLYDCLKEKKEHNLSDWAYYRMLQTLVDQFYGKESNEGALVLAHLMSHSGYKVRMAYDENHLYMLAASHHYIYRLTHAQAKTYIGSESYYLLDGRKLPYRLNLCEAYFKGETPISLLLPKEQQHFADNPTRQRTIASRVNDDFSFTITSNKNYVDFCNTYPRSSINSNYFTSWMMYAETPMEEGMRKQLYPPMEEKLNGLSQQEQVQQLLWWVQGTMHREGFDNENCLLYDFDETVWGEDRPFFSEETLYYPYCDCEDRAILFSRLVRDLLGLDVALVYYPEQNGYGGHLATAVAFTEEVSGDYFEDGGRRFVVCDPTIMNGYIGDTMDYYEGGVFKYMLLRRN